MGEIVIIREYALCPTIEEQVEILGYPASTSRLCAKSDCKWHVNSAGEYQQVVLKNSTTIKRCFITSG